MIRKIEVEDDGTITHAYSNYTMVDEDPQNQNGGIEISEEMYDLIQSDIIKMRGCYKYQDGSFVKRSKETLDRYGIKDVPELPPNPIKKDWIYKDEQPNDTQ